MPSHFVVGEPYTREEIAEKIGMPADRRRGGNWATGYDKWAGEFFVFCNIGIAGRSGHDYANRWDGKALHWFAKNGSRLGQPVIDEMIARNAQVQIFWRGKDRAAFTYAGRATALTVYDQSPVAVVWSFESDEQQFEVGSQASEGTTAAPAFRRGPPPSPGERTVEIPDGETMLYLMQLEGDCHSILPTLTDEHIIIKVGISNSPSRRVTELNQGFPPGSKIGWRLLRHRRFESGMGAFLVESECLEQLRNAGQWIGGEFAVVHLPALDDLIKARWPD